MLGGVLQRIGWSLTRLFLGNYRRCIGVGLTDDALRARQVNNSFDLSFFFEVLFENTMKFAGEMGTGPGLGDSGKDCKFGTFYLDVLRVFLSRLRLYALPSIPSIDSDWPDYGEVPRVHFGVPCRGPFPTTSRDLYARRLAGESSPHELNI